MAAHEKSPSLTTGIPTHILVNSRWREIRNYWNLQALA
jgi:hypothetical protein